MAIFNQVANQYDQWLEEPLGKFIYQREVDLMLSMLDTDESMTILDAGSGTGNFTFELAKSGANVVGIDVSEEMINQAQTKLSNQNNIQFNLMDMYQLEFPDQSFDVVVSMTAFEFIDQPEKAFEELYRVLKPGGQLLIGTITKSGSWGRLYQSKAFADDPIYQHSAFKDMDDLSNLRPDEIVDKGETLFITPETPEDKLNEATEKELSEVNEAGFISVLWRKEQIMTCQISFYPLGSDKLDHNVDRIIELIEQSHLEYQIGEMSTFLRGKSQKIFNLLKEIHDKANQLGITYAMNVTLSNECGC